MSFNINNFKSEINRRNGPMRTNKFKVTMTAPVGLFLQDAVSGVSRSLEFWCESVNLPGYIIGSHDVRRWTFGPVEKRALTPSFTDLQCTFINDNKSSIWGFFQSWQQLILPHERQNGINTSRRGAFAYELDYKTNYATDIVIEVFKETGVRTIKVTCLEAFPAQIPDTPFSWADTNNVMRFPVVFHYLDWHVDGV